MPDFSFITNYIFVGNVHSVAGNLTTKELDSLDDLNIKVIISALNEEEYEDYMITEADFPDIIWHRFVIDDDKNQNISQYFSPVHAIISKAISENKNVIVHCAAGMSRSTSLVIAYLMIQNKWAYEEAYNFVKKRRPITEPNTGFVKQLKQLENSIKCAN